MHKPFIHCFKTAKEYYVYDVNTDKIIQVSFETYNFLENNIWDEKAEREIEKLINEGYLKRTRVEEVKHFATDFLESYLENRMNQLVLQVTQKCNLRCSYCVYSGDYKNRNHSQKEMSWETAKEAVDYLYGHSMSSEDIYISFYGGEPLLMFRLIKEVVEYVKREYCQRTVHFNLTTNGTLFTPEIVQYFIKNNIQIMFSLDGPKEVHDKNRIFAGSNRGSFEKLRDSMKMIYSMDRKYYKKNVSFNTVLDPQNELRTIYEFLDKDRLISKNLSRISVLNDNYTDKQCEFSGEFVEEQEYEYFKCFLSKLKRINEKFVARAVKEEFDNEMREIKQHEEKMQEEISKVNHHSGPCIPGAKKIFVTAEGNIYPCERVSEISEVSKIGDIKKGIDKNKVLNPMPKDSLVYTGHYIDHELVQGIEEDCAARRARKMQKKPMRFLLTIGGAGAQKEIFAEIIRYLIPHIRDGRAALYVNVGDYKNVWEQLKAEIPQMKTLSCEHFNNWENTKKFAEEALTGEVTGIHGFWHENIFEAVYCTNLLMRSCDVLVTKPSELAFYPVPKLFIKRVGGHEQWGAVHSAEIGDGTLECRDTGHTLQMLELFLNEETLLFQMCNCIEANKKAGIYDGAYKAVELAAAESR